MREKAKLSATTNIAPAFIPSTPASAKGFRVTPCITAPATAKPLLQLLHQLPLGVLIHK